jgi:hypothetical protein
MSGICSTSRVAQDHLERMARIIDYHLKRASARNQPVVMMVARVSVKATAQRLLASLNKVFHDKASVQPNQDFINSFAKRHN